MQDPLHKNNTSNKQINAMAKNTPACQLAGLNTHLQHSKVISIKQSQVSASSDLNGMSQDIVSMASTQATSCMNKHS
jgi:hypothetical protein